MIRSGALAVLSSAVALGLVLSACTRPPQPDSQLDSVAPIDSGAPEPLRLALDASGKRNLLLIHVDTLNAAHTPWYGYNRDTFPLLSTRAWDVVDGYTATASWTASATASVLTGTDVDRHGVLWSTFDGDDRGSGEVNQLMRGGSLAEHLGGLGYATALWSGNAFVTDTSGLSRGFDHFSYDQKVNQQSNAGALATKALGWLDGLSGEKPFFIMLQPMDPHLPYSPDPRDLGTWVDLDNLLFDPISSDHRMEDQYRELIGDPALAEAAYRQWNDLYDEELLGLDRGLATLLDGLEARGLLDETLVVLTADHGEALGDMSYEVVGHGKAYRPEVLRSPLLVLSDAGDRQSCLSSGTDLAPTLLRALGLAPMQDATGVALQDACRDSTFSSFYLPQGLRFMSAQDAENMLVLDCNEAQVQGLDLVAGPVGGVFVDPESLPELRATLDDGVVRHQLEIDNSACTALLQ